MSALSRPDGAADFWSLIQAYCGLEDPAHFKPFAWTIPTEDRRVLARYLRTCDHLAKSTLMNTKGGIKLKWHAVTNKTKVEKDLGAPDAVAGYLTLFRQVFAPGEGASFDKVRKVIGQAAHRTAADDALATIASWKKANTTLLSTHQDRMRAELAKLRTRGKDPAVESLPGTRMGLAEDPTPDALIRTYFYGDAIHCGTTRDDVERWRSDPATDAFMEHHVTSDALLLGHFYLGFGVVVRTVLASSSPSHHVHRPHAEA